MDDPQVPFAEPLSTPQWALVDVVAAVLTGMVWATAIAVSGPFNPSGGAWVRQTMRQGLRGVSSPPPTAFLTWNSGCRPVATRVEPVAVGCRDREHGRPFKGPAFARGSGYHGCGSRGRWPTAAAALG